MKKLAASIFSMILIFSVGTTTALAEPDVGVMSAPEEEVLVSEQEVGENTADQDNGLNDDEPSGEPGAEDEKSDELDDASGTDDIDEEEPSEGSDSLTEEEEEEQEESEEPEEKEEEEAEVEELAVVPFDVEDYVEYKELSPQELLYDDRYDLSEDGFPAEGTYVIYKTEFAEGEGITSNQVSNGTQGEPDEELLTFKEEGSTTVIASGVGSGTVWLVREDQKDALDEILSLEEGLETGELDPVYVNANTVTAEDPDEEDSDEGGLSEEDLKEDGLDEENPDDTSDVADLDGEDIVSEIPAVILDTDEMITVYQIHVTVEPATLTLMFLTGQSNMEGMCSSNTGYERTASIACEAGTVYSTYAPSSSSYGSNVGGVGEACTAGNAADFVAGSLQGGMNMSGGTLPYPLNSLTTEGGGKTGPDSGLAYEWNQLTGDKVWVVNTAYNGTNISGWVSGGTYYERSKAVWDNVLNTYNAEIAAGHYNTGKKLVFWLQGETDDRTMQAADYESYFANMYNSMTSALSPTAFGIIMVRASTGSYKTDDEWAMTGPRIAQYWLGSGYSSYSNVYVVSNDNEQWVSDEGVSTYFNSAYPNGLIYPMHGVSKSVPTTVSEVHNDIHYSQVGHNENGIKAAYGMWEALNTASPTGVSWRDEYGKEISSVTFDVGGDVTTMVEVAQPAYAAKSISYNYGDYAAYDGATGTLTGYLTGEVTSSVGSPLQITVKQPTDLTSVAGKNYTGIYYYKGTWWYLKNGIIQRGFESIEHNENGWWYINDGKVDFTYTGFAHNSNGWYYVEEGKVKFDKYTVLQDENKKIDGTNGWYYIIESKVQENYTGLADYSNDNGWWYVKNGKVDFDANTVAHNKNGWFYVEGGKVNFSYNGFGQNSNGWWYCEGGKVNFDKNSVIQDTNKKIDGTSGWWYVVGSEVQTKFTGLADYSNSNGWWYIENGKVTFTKDTIAHNKNGWYYVKDSKVNFNFTGLADFPNENGWWYCEKGKVTFSKDTIAKNKNGWYYVKNSKVDFGFTGLADFPNENGWWYCENGKVYFNKNTIAQNKNGWYYVKDSKVDFSFNGIAQNGGGWWYIKNGKVDFSFTGTVTESGKKYSVKKGKVDK